MGFVATMGLSIHANKLAAQYEKICLVQFQSTLQILNNELGFVPLFGRGEIGGEAQLALKSFQAWITMQTMLIKNYVSPKDQREFIGYLLVAIFGKDGKSYAQQHIADPFILELNKDRNNRSRVMHKVSLHFLTYVSEDLDARALHITAQLLRIFDVNVRQAIAHEFKDRLALSALQEEQSVTTATLSLNISEQKGGETAFCRVCRTQVPKQDNFCISCGTPQKILAQSTTAQENTANRNTPQQNKSTNPALPSLTLNLLKICEAGLNWSSPSMERSYIGRTYGFREGPLKQASISTHQNLDDVLSLNLVKGFFQKPITTPTLVWFFMKTSPSGEPLIALSFSCKRRANFDWICDMPGYFESGEESVPPTARPYAYWDGVRIYRTHDIPSGSHNKETFATDFYPGLGMLVGTASKDSAARIARRERDCWEYSLIPNNHQQILKIDGRDTPLLHVKTSIPE